MSPNAITYRARSDLRRRWRSWVVMGVLLGLAGGAAMAAAAGARRTESAYPRFLASQRALDVLVDVRGPDGIPAPVEALRSIPEVEDAAGVVALFASDVTTATGRRMSFPDVFVIGASDGRFGTELNVAKVIEGRRPDPASTDEVLVAFSIADRYGISVGDEIVIRLLDPGPESTPTSEVAVTQPARVAGIGAMPGGFQALAGASIPSIQVTSAFMHEHGLLPSLGEAFAVRFRGGLTDLEGFREAVDALGFREQAFYKQVDQSEVVQRSARFQAVGLWLLAGLMGLAAAAILGQALARQAFNEADEYPALMALGFRPGQLIAVGVGRWLVIAPIAAVLGAAFSVAASPLTPIGLARIAEPDPGSAIDLTVVGVGAVSMLFLVGIASAIPQWRVARVRGRMRPTRPRRGSRIAASFARTGFPASVVVGTRLALEAGRGPSAVPVRSAVTGVALGILAVVSSLTLATSMDHLVATPRLSGWTFDMVYGGPPHQVTGYTEELVSRGMLVARHQGSLPSFLVEGEDVLDAALVLPPGLEPAVADGRAATAPDEVTLGRDTMRELGLSIGDELGLALQFDDTYDITNDPEGATERYSEERRFRIVGRHIQPAIGFNLSNSGQGIAMTIGGYARFGEPDPVDTATFVTLRSTEDISAAIEEIAADYPGLFISARGGSNAASDVARIQGMPALLAAVLGLTAAATMAHAIAVTIRRRARELAVLRTIGFIGRQVRSAVAWQATIVVLIALAIGAPLGIAAGRQGWMWFADTIGVVTVAVTPVVASLIAVPLVLLAANTVAVVPGHRAARAQPAAILRKE